jgi:uncharacterized protein YbjT (DUF2867 family)
MMPDSDTHIVTGAFGYTGRHIARRLLDRGLRVKTLTSRDAGDGPFGDRIEVAPLCFDDPGRLTEHLRGAAAFYNTYWVRFAHGGATHKAAVANTKTLIRCAAEAGVRRFVHVSITNPSVDSPLSYFRGKAELERALIDSGLSYAILRPAVLFGEGDILLNNIAWMLRRMPVFGVFGRGDYRLQPVFVEDLADLAVACAMKTENLTLDAVGPETFTYNELVATLKRTVGSRAGVLHVPPIVGLAIGKCLGWWMRDVVVTREEIAGLMADLLVSHDEPTCPTRLTDWLNKHGHKLGRRYASELRRHYRKRSIGIERPLSCRSA